MVREDLERIFREPDRIARIQSLEPINKLSSHAIGCIINYFVEKMSPQHCYLNIGTWQGFSLVAGAIGNPTKICIGVDNWSQATGFDELKANINHYQNIFFHSMDYHKYFSLHHKEIGVYFYDADHSADCQHDNLVLAHPFIPVGGIVFVDDWNWAHVKEGTNRFLHEHPNFQIIFEEETPVHAVTESLQEFWNGLVIIERIY